MISLKLLMAKGGWIAGFWMWLRIIFGQDLSGLLRYMFGFSDTRGFVR